MQSKLRIGRLPALGLLSMVGLLAATFAAIPAQAQTVAYSGRAYVVGLNGVHSPLLNLSLATSAFPDTILPAGGGTVSSGPSPITVDALVTATVATAAVSGVMTGSPPSEDSTATSTVATVTIPNVLVATALTAATHVDCDEGLVAHTSSVAGLTIDGIAVPAAVLAGINSTYIVRAPVTGALVATVVANRQAYDPATNTASADALIVMFPSDGVLAGVIQGTVVLSHAESDLNCNVAPTPTPAPTPAPTAAPTTTPSGPAPSLPSTGHGPAQSSPFDGTSGALGIIVLLLISASTASTGFVLWRRRSHLTS